ncbi:MAG: 1-deoxy-D-xylulose-5-phosphate reductoisomerase, partial [Gammaproteobacteria bacterium]|nr:1-deoxy-D-xylulose-5-phosphate reductoisomerase [Gammaproteobacteria bacterium]
ALKRLDFEPLSLERFPCVRLAYQALKAGGTATAILNAANEIAVEAFCHNQIRFDQIATLIDAVMQKADIVTTDDLNTVLNADQNAREFATQMLKESVYSFPIK